MWTDTPLQDEPRQIQELASEHKFQVTRHAVEFWSSRHLLPQFDVRERLPSEICRFLAVGPKVDLQLGHIEIYLFFL